jgi:hypothetical protein
MNQKELIRGLIVSLVVVIVSIMVYMIFNQEASVINPLSPSTVSLQKLEVAPEKIIINGGDYTLETYLWRDFMPISPPDGKPLIAVVKIKSSGKMNVSSEITATRMWVVNGKEIWETEFTDEQPSATSDTLEKVGRSGPKWGPGIPVDVIVKVIDLKSGKDYLLKASDQNIYRTD